MKENLQWVMKLTALLKGNTCGNHVLTTELRVALPTKTWQWYLTWLKKRKMKALASPQRELLATAVGQLVSTGLVTNKQERL
jgi:hypothetical protein